MSDDSTTRVVSDSGNDIGPGQRLREAREAAKLTSAEVASRMRLEPYILEKLENDDYEQLHGPTFVRGYLSGYARLLNLPERPILEAYERHGYGPPALVSELGGKAEVHVSDFPVRMTTYVIAGLLVVLVVMWWQSRQVPTDSPEMARTLDAHTTAMSPTPAAEPTDGDPASSASAETSAESPAGASPDTASREESSAAAPEPPAPGPEIEASNATESEAASSPPPPEPMVTPEEPAPSAAGETAPSPPVPENPVVGEPRQETSGVGVAAVDPSPDPSAEAVAATDGAEQATTTMDTNTAAETETETEVSPPRPAPLPGSDVLAIQLQRESWIEVYDRGGGRLYYSLAREGSEVVVQGAGPMQVLLGEVEGAAVAYNGEPFDLSRYQGRSVVRFTIGELTSITPETPPPANEEPAAPNTPEPTARAGEQTAAVVPETLEAPAAPAAAPEVTLSPPAPIPAEPATPAVTPDS
jgi:cytoskeleton protein RodZ